MATTDHDEDDLEQVAVTGDPPADLPQGDHEDDLHDEDEGEGSTAKHDAELEEAADPAEREAIIKRRRENRRNKNQRQKEKMERLQSDNRALNDRLARLEQGFSGLQNTSFGQQLANVDAEIGKANQAHAYFMRIEADAIAKQNGPAAVQARENATTARLRAEQLTELKNNAVAANRQQQARPPAIDPTVQNKATEFVKRHSWYKGRDATDADSMVLNALDAGLIREGMDPRSDGYWDELQSRMTKHLAHRIEKDYDGRNGSQGQRSSQGRVSPVAGSSSASPPSGQTSRLSPDQVQAIKDAGMWNDPAQRAKAIKAYVNYAKTH